MNTSEHPGVTEEQLLYGRVLEIGARLGLVAAVVGFLLYVAGVLPGRVPLDEMAQLWTLPLHEYLQRTAAPVGWGWLGLAAHGEFASLIGIAILASCSVPCLLAVLPTYLRRRDRVYAVLCVLEVVVLALAASGWLVLKH